MKTTEIIKAFALFLIGFMVFSCQKPEISNESEEVTPAFFINGYSASITYSCEGNCSASEACGMTWDLGAGTIECTCTACKMNISTERASGNSGGGLPVSRVDMKKIGNFFVEYIQRTNNASSYRIQKYTHHYYELAEVMEIEYTVNGVNSNLHKVVLQSFFYTTDPHEPAYKNIVVDCFGSCDSAGDLCVEVFKPASGEVYCKCQSANCKMNIEESTK